MTVKQYLVENANKSAYTIKQGKKSFLCTLFEANSFFGNKEVKKITYKYDSAELPVLHLE